jgi:hypothetical protein
VKEVETWWRELRLGDSGVRWSLLRPLGTKRTQEKYG